MEKRYQGSRQEARTLDAYVKLVRAAETITTRVHKHLTAFGLTLSQFAVLEALYHLGPLYQREIGQKLLKSSGNITMVIDNLEKRGYVSRDRKKEDRRFLNVRLTGEGFELISKVFPPHAAVIAREMSVLNAGEQETLARLCKKLGLTK